jgi:hypothetical protein
VVVHTHFSSKSCVPYIVGNQFSITIQQYMARLIWRKITLYMIDQGFRFFKVITWSSARVALVGNSRNRIWQWIVDNERPHGSKNICQRAWHGQRHRGLSILAKRLSQPPICFLMSFITNSYCLKNLIQPHYSLNLKVYQWKMFAKIWKRAKSLLQWW